MNKRGGIYFLIVLVLMLNIVFLSAQVNSTEETKKVNDAYSCLADKIKDVSCGSLSNEEKSFSLLATGQCQSDLLSASTNSGECWSSSGSGSCSIKTTSQAILALDNVNANTNKAEDWLLSQNKSTTELTWYLQIESENPTICNIQYSGLSYDVDIDSDKQLSNNAGSCLIRAENDYWYRVSPSCYGVEFSVSCDESFLTNTLFKKSTSSTIHVSPETSSASASGTTTEKVESFCFEENGICNYEGSLWAVMVLDSLGNDISGYIPYLITLAEDNIRYLPESFLYFITPNQDYRDEILLGQKSNKYWSVSGDLYYDTALALYPFQSETITEKTNSKEWLLDSQDSNGCWDNNVRNTAFILASLWPKQLSSSGSTSNLDCESAGFYCSSSASCFGSGGETLSEYDCPSLYKCCSVQPGVSTCSELGGETCSSNQRCAQGTTSSTPDLASGEVCCVDGFCENVPQPTLSACESSGGTCRPSSCNNNEELSSLNCDFSGDSCCIPSSTTKKSYWWIWLLLILILLVIIGIIFRQKLGHFWFRIKSKFKKSPRGPMRRPMPPHHVPLPRRPPTMERRILLPAPVQPRPQPTSHKPGPKPKSTAEKELDEVLKKLKDMSK